MTHRNKVNWTARNNFLFWEQNNSLRRIYTPDPYFHVASVYSQGFSWIFLNFNTDEQDPQCPIFSCYNASIETKLKRYSAKAFNAFNVHNHFLDFLHMSRTKGYISRGCLIMPLFCPFDVTLSSDSKFFSLSPANKTELYLHQLQWFNGRSPSKWPKRQI